MDRLTKRHGKHAVQIVGETRRNDIGWLALADYEDLEEQGKLVEQRHGRWIKSSKEKPNSTRHLIVASGEDISRYGYYVKPKDKWYTNWKCEEEISEPMYWMEMPEVPKESIYGECCAKMDEVE